MAETVRALEMRGMMEEYASSGQTRREFCSRQGIALSTFDYWRRELAKQPQTRLVAVKIATAEARFALVLGNGRRIECGEQDVEQLIRIAERA